jgi:hypothetical protein
MSEENTFVCVSQHSPAYHLDTGTIFQPQEYKYFIIFLLSYV